MDQFEVAGRGIIEGEQNNSLEIGMLSKERWEQIRHLQSQGESVLGIARRLDIDRKTVRKAIRQEWRSYDRAARSDTLLRQHKAFLDSRVSQVGFSARILFQELCRDHGFTGSYETVKRFVAPLRDQADLSSICERRFETPPGQQSQIDWGQVRTHLREQPITLHLFVLTLGFSRRSYYRACASEQMSAFLESHEAAFKHFGGLTREHLYDRPRTVCEPNGGGWRWNESFKAFAGHWGFEPRLCQPYRAQTKGKVESGVKYVKRNFMPGRQFTDIVDVQAQLDEWMATTADTRIHGTTHQRPIDRFAQELPALMPIHGHGPFAESRLVNRIVAEDYLVSFHANRYSVPYKLIGKTVTVVPVGGQIRIEYDGNLVAEHARVAGKHQMVILPEHGPGPIARNARQRQATPVSPHRWWGPPEVEVRDPAVYEGANA